MGRKLSFDIPAEREGVYFFYIPGTDFSTLFYCGKIKMQKPVIIMLLRVTKYEGIYLPKVLRLEKSCKIDGEKMVILTELFLFASFHNTHDTSF